MYQLQIEVLQRLDSIILSLQNNNSWIPNLICTLLGVFFGAMITYIFQIIGKLNIYVMEFKYEYKKNEMGNIIKTESINNAFMCYIDITIDFYNTKQSTIGLRSTNIEVY